MSAVDPKRHLRPSITTAEYLALKVKAALAVIGGWPLPRLPLPAAWLDQSV
jgi:hypothetical protein